MNNSIKKAAPGIMAVLASAGVVGTSILTAIATTKAIALCADGDDTVAKVKKTWKYYIPAASAGMSTILLIAGSASMNASLLRSAEAATVFVGQTFKAYQDTVKDIYGADAHKMIMERVDAERAIDVHVTAESCLASTSLDFESDDEPIHTFYDEYSDRYFETTLSRVLEAEYHLNRNFQLGAFPCVNDFYDFLGISRIAKDGDKYWAFDDGMSWIDFNHRKEIVDGLDIYVIEMVYEPHSDAEYEKEYFF